MTPDTPVHCKSHFALLSWGYVLQHGIAQYFNDFNDAVCAVPTVIVPHAHWEAYGRGSLPLHNLVSDSANPHYVSDPLPQSFVGSS